MEPRVSQASGSTLAVNAAQNIAPSISNELFELGTATERDAQNLFTNGTNTFGGIETFPVPINPVLSSMVTTSDFLGSPSSAFFDVPGGHAQSLDLSLMPLHASSPLAAPGLQTPSFGQNSLHGAAFQDVGLPSENNMMFFSMLKNIDFKQKLPSAQLENILQSKGIVLDKPAGHTIFGGFAPRFVAGILSSKDQSMVRQPPNLQLFLRKLGSQVPGESSALITDDQAFETKFARVLLFSMLNGFAGLDDVPMENILRFLNRFVINKLLLDVLEQCPRHVSRTLADNIFRAAIEAADTNVVKLLLERKLVDANETVYYERGMKWTPIQRASQMMSLRLMIALIDAGADVNKSYVKEYSAQLEGTEGDDGALHSLMSGIQSILRDDYRSTIPPESIEAFNILVAAGARVYPTSMILDDIGRTMEFDLLIFQNIPFESHRGFFENVHLYQVAEKFDDRSATVLVRAVMSLCHEADCNKCLVDFGDHLRSALLLAAKTGKTELLHFLLDKLDLEPQLPQIFLASIETQNHTLIDFILSKAPDLDPPAIQVGHECRTSTPISEAVRCGNEDLIRRLEAGGSLDQLSEGGRFEALVYAAAEVGDTAYTRKLLTRAVTSKQACRVMGEALECAIRGDHQDILQMLLEAGAVFKRLYRGEGPLLDTLRQSNWNAQMMRDLTAAGADILHMRESQAPFTRGDLSIILELVHEYPDLEVDSTFFQAVLSVCIEHDIPEYFKEILQTSWSKDSVLDGCLETAIEFGRADLVKYLLDMGANPLDRRVLRAVIPDRPDILRLLFQKERLRQTMPKCIGASVLMPVMGNCLGNAEALDELIRTEAMNFVRLEYIYYSDPYGELGEYCKICLTPLGLAIQGVGGRFDTNMVAMKKFLDAGADPDGISKSNAYGYKGPPLMTALMVAIETDREDAVNMLLDYRADVNACPLIRTTRTALQYAAELGNMDMVRLLVSRGADVNSSAPSRRGATALQFAAISGNCNMVAHLLDHGAQLDALPSRIDGMWPLEGAAANGRLDMIRYLWELNDREVRELTFPKGFSERQCLRAMNFARENGHIGCRDLISELSGISVERLETDEYGAPWIAYDID